MSKAAIKTNNDEGMFAAKVKLRLNSLPDKDEILVLECFGGEGLLWKEVQKQTEKKITILSIDKNKYQRLQLLGENLKFIKSFDLSVFDIIDLDAWGSPFKQLEIVFNQKYIGVVHCTFIQTMTGNLDKKLLKYNGFSDAMLKKCQSIFTKNGIDKFKNYLAIKGIKKISICSKNRKNYLYFNLDK